MIPASPPLLAYVPFLHPIQGVHDWWYLLVVPLALGIAMIYKALRLRTFEHYIRGVIFMTTQIVIAMIGLAIALVILVQVVIPRLPAE